MKVEFKDLLLSVIIVTFNSENDIFNCVKSIQTNITSIKKEIIIVDNNSVINLEDEFDNYDDIIFLRQNSNFGFSKANNIGFSYAKGDILLFLNPDTVLLDDSLEKMIFDNYSDLDHYVLAPKLLYENNDIQQSCRSFPTKKNFLLNTCKFNVLFPNYKNNYILSKKLHGIELSPDWVSGACFVINRSNFELVNGFSEDYFLFAEDMDIFYKLNKKGVNIKYFPSYVIKHLEGQSINFGFNRLKLELDSRLIFYKKYYKNVDVMIKSEKFYFFSRFFTSMILFKLNKCKIYKNLLSYMREKI